MDPKQTWEIRDSDTMLVGKEIKLYQRAIGQLMYLMLGTCLDICYVVTELVQASTSPTVCHLQGVLKVFRYLCSHDSIKLSLEANVLMIPPSVSIHPPTNLVSFFDASLMDCPKMCKSTGAYILFLYGSYISWSSKKQGLVALSSTESEFIAEAEAVKETLSIMNFLESISYADITKDPHL